MLGFHPRNRGIDTFMLLVDNEFAIEALCRSKYI